MFSSVRFLLSRSGSSTTEFLGFASSRISNQHRSIVRREYFFNFTFGLFIDEFLVESNDTFANSLTDGIDLRSVTSSSHSYSNIEISKSLTSQNINGF